MRKYFEGHSPKGVVIIFCAFALAIFLRFYALSVQSPWTDEIASWWYLRHLDTVFYRESHSPLFYGILRVFLGSEATLSAIRHFVAAISVLHLIEFFFLGQLALKKRAFLLFWVLICLNPADIVHARMARHYSWLLEGSLVYFLLWKIGARQWSKLLTGTFTAFIHVFAVIPITVLAGYDFYRSRKWRDLGISLIPCFLVSVYYASRFVIFGREKVLANISWVSSPFYQFFTSTVTQFFGDSYPRFEFYPVLPELCAILFGLSLALILYYRKPSGRIFLILAITSILIVEMLMPFTSFRVNRYLIYLSGFWLYAIADSLEDVKDYIFYPVMVMPVLFLLYFNPLLNYPWEDARVERWKAYRKSEPDTQFLVCANDYQNEYYDFKPGGECLDRVLLIDNTKPFIFFDMTGTQTYIVASFLEKMDVTDYFPGDFGGVMMKFTPKKIIQKVVKKKKKKARK